jgi:hypothetical protein
MPAGTQDADDLSEDWTIERALALLEQALEIIDHRTAPPEIGARLQEIIEQVQELKGPRPRLLS